MKNVFFLLVILCLGLTTQAQSPIQVDFSQGQATLDNLFTQFSTQETSSQLLAGRSMQSYRKSFYKASTEQDSFIHSPMAFEILYQAMYAARTPANDWLQHPQTALEPIFANLDQASNDIYLSFAGYELQSFDPVAYQTGKLYLNADQQLELSQGTSLGSCLLTEQAYSSTLLQKQTAGLLVQLHLNSAHLFGNLAVTQLEVDAGAGYKAVPLDGSTSMRFDSAGVHTLKLKWGLASGETIVHYHRLDVQAANSVNQDTNNSRNPHKELFHADSIYKHTDFSKFFGQQSIFATFKMACPDAKYEDIQKPFIVLDGIDLTWEGNDMNGAKFFGEELLAADTRFLDSISLKDYLLENNYDIIFVDYVDHHRPIQENAAAVQDMLRSLKAVMAKNGSGHPIRMAGMSMGGLIGKYALLDMESNGEQHGVDKYITFDSPMQGANIPLALQGLIKQLSEVLTVINSKETKIKTMINDTFDTELIIGMHKVLTSPAAQQMLVYQFDEPENTNPVMQSYLDFYQELANFGELEQCAYYAIANGSSLGATGHQGIASDTLFRIDFDNPNFFVALFRSQLKLWYANYNIDATGFQVGTQENGEVYNGTITMYPGFTSCIYDINSEVQKTVENVQRMDNAPGGMISDRRIIPDGISLDALEDFGEFVIPLPLHLCFIPTVSALDIDHNNTIPMHPNVYEAINNQNGPTTRRTTHLTGSSVQILQNAGHVNINLVTMSFLAEVLGGNNHLLGDALKANQIFNFGNLENAPLVIDPQYTPTSISSYLSQNLVVPNGAQLWANRAGKLGFQHLNSYDTPNENNYKFDVHITGTNCKENIIDVQFLDNSTFHIGDASVNNQSFVHVAHTNLTMHTGSHLKIEDGSKLIIRNKARLVLETGVNYDISDKAELFIDGHLKTTGDVTIHCNGKLRIGKYASFDLGGKLTIIGDNIQDELLLLESAAKVISTQDIAIENGTLTFGYNALFQVNNANQVELSEVHIRPQDVSSGYKAFELTNVNQVHVQGSIVEDFCRYSGLIIKSSNQVDVMKSQFLRNENGLIIDDFNQVNIVGSKFSNLGKACYHKNRDESPLIHRGLYLNQGVQVDISDSEFSYFGYQATNSYSSGIRIQDVRDVRFEDATIKGNAIGIHSYSYANEKNANLYISNSMISDNIKGIKMKGTKASNDKEFNYGLLLLECTSILDNYFAGVEAEDIFIQADKYFTGDAAGYNRFKPYQGKDLENEIGFFNNSQIFKVIFTTSLVDEIYLRGNAWYENNTASTFYNSTTNQNLNIITVPMLPWSVLQCSEVSEPDTDKGPCINCLKEDEADCKLTVGTTGEKAGMTAMYRQAINHLRAGQREAAVASFNHIANVEKSLNWNSLSDKCKMFYEVSRVFALPNPTKDEGIQIRATGEEEELTLRVTPVPSSDYIQIEGMKAGRYEIMNTNGAKVGSGVFDTDTRIDVSDLAGSMYFLRAIAPNGKIQTTSFIVIK